MLFGLGIGLAVALVVYLKSAPPDLQSFRAPFTEALERGVPADGAGTARIEAAALPALPPEELAAEPAADGTDLAFYELLRQLEVTVPGPDPARAAQTPAQEYVIQAGSFRTHEDADRLRVRLVLLGMDAEIRRAIVGNEIYHRVVIGPLDERGEINRILRRLREERIEAMRLVSD